MHYLHAYNNKIHLKRVSVIVYKYEYNNHLVNNIRK